MKLTLHDRQRQQNHRALHWRVSVRNLIVCRQIEQLDCSQPAVDELRNGCTNHNPVLEDVDCSKGYEPRYEKEKINDQRGSKGYFGRQPSQRTKANAVAKPSINGARMWASSQGY